MLRYRKWAAAFCGLSATSITLALAAGTTLPSAPLIGWILGMLFIILAAMMMVINSRQ